MKSGTSEPYCLSTPSYSSSVLSQAADSKGPHQQIPSTLIFPPWQRSQAMESDDKPNQRKALKQLHQLEEAKDKTVMSEAQRGLTGMGQSTLLAGGNSLCPDAVWTTWMRANVKTDRSILSKYRYFSAACKADHGFSKVLKKTEPYQTWFEFMFMHILFYISLWPIEPLFFGCFEPEF